MKWEILHKIMFLEEYFNINIVNIFGGVRSKSARWAPRSPLRSDSTALAQESLCCGSL